MEDGFDVSELRQFCFDEKKFRPVYNKFASDPGKAEIIHQLIIYAEQKNLFGLLLEWAEEQSPKYKDYEPYKSNLSPIPDITVGNKTDERYDSTMPMPNGIDLHIDKWGARFRYFAANIKSESKSDPKYHPPISLHNPDITKIIIEMKPDGPSVTFEF